MSNNGGVPYGSDEPTSFGLQPPRPSAAVPHADHVPHPGNPYAAPTQVVPPQQAAAAQDPGAGRLIGGRYRLLSKLGHGGMGTVWRAKDETVDREVAVKEPRIPDHLPERERANAFERMRREARAAARLDHPAVVNVHDVAVVDDQPWIVMELVQGRSLGDVLQEGTLGAREAARVGLEVLGALEAAHAAGILHRDVKPDNVLLGRHERVVLTDFGIAQIEGETNLTDTGGFVGSPEYIAPERVLGQRPGPASDLWSLGVVLYAATEGVSPFRRSNTPATLQSVLNATPAAPASAQGPLAEVITGLLQKDPARRPNAAQTRALLEKAANPPAPAPTQVVQLGGTQRGVRLGGKSLTAIGAAVAAIAVAAAYLVIADPFAGEKTDSWKTKDLGTKVGASIKVPPGFKELPAATDSDGTVVAYADPSGVVRITVDRDVKKDDTDGEIPATASEKAFADWEMLKDGEYTWDIADSPAPRGKPKETTWKEREAAENTVFYTTTSTTAPLKREARVLYYRAGNGDMYRLWIDYPAEGYFTEESREIARTTIDNWEIHKP
ncbi:serine/threonine-protein kinase [Streptomyces sp. P17]|uniref:serine/threonine-protein kinase n=1 Tax=Streptomyces sp. P17 TaxID=3074716 RepID=UPI0028F41699|nr:serine/threonine-protein kinase [Streptomyces sp. P17]MDT9697825.1 serine/threonine-protein kinase [Streptomyces sp. P17]